MIDRVPLYTKQTDFGTFYQGRLPNIIGEFGVTPYNHSATALVGTGCFVASQTGATVRSFGWADQQYKRWIGNFNASRSSKLYQDAVIVEAAGISMLWCIKY